ncbi:MAG: peptidoglycan DD-metalloendopeptidase family protein [Desulfuromonadales bacterium]|nr:peptidoglycan DD-metalloendopeptidase family protein [Desulfuromonadales bacterium]
MDFDLKPPNQSPASKKPRTKLTVLYYVLGLAVTIITLNIVFQDFTPATEAHAVAPQPKLPEIQRESLVGKIENGDTMTALLGAYLTPQKLYSLNEQCKPIFSLTRISTGQPYRITLADGAFERFEYDINPETELIIDYKQGEFTISKEPINYHIELETIQGTITSSLFEAVAEIGETPELAMNLANIFAWDIDFILDIRTGDQFQALVEKRLRDGKPAGYGQILAAEFTNQNETYRAFLFQDGDRPASYYDANGNNVRKLFLKAPLSFSHISSGFTNRRLHPITKTWKSHPAIDYAAPRGTPIKSVGDGTIVKISKDQYNGNHIKIRHNSTYQTLYLHMDRFAKGVKKGKKIYQGEVIGYVGSTGLATGPHLCFRMYQNGNPVNPNRVKTRSAEPVSEANKTVYLSTIEILTARFTQPQLIAVNSPPESH